MTNALACQCPSPPDLSELSRAELDRIIGKPLRCTDCGQDLELTCPKGHVHHAPVTRSPNHRPKATPDAPAASKPCRKCHEPFTPRPFQRTCDRCESAAAEKRCLSCRKAFTPKQFQRRCDACLSAVPEKGALSHRVYAAKPCHTCKRPFQPTGPRALFCKQPDCAPPARGKKA